MSLARHCSPVIGTLLLLGLSACNSGNGYSGAQNTIAVTPSASGTIKAVSGGSRALSLAFISSDSQPITDLRVTSGLSPPTGRMARPGDIQLHDGHHRQRLRAQSHICADERRQRHGDDRLQLHQFCRHLAYRFDGDSLCVDQQRQYRRDRFTDRQINAMVGGGAQAVTVTFDTDDGNPASALSLTTDLATLPAGWSSTDHSFSCASVSSGNGCQLPLSYVPAAVGSGTLTLNFSLHRQLRHGENRNGRHRLRLHQQQQRGGHDRPLRSGQRRGGRRHPSRDPHLHHR